MKGSYSRLNNEFVIFGATTGLSEHKYSNQVGFLMTTDYDKSCLPLQNILDAIDFVFL